jgi:hypothetical protein
MSMVSLLSSLCMDLVGNRRINSQLAGERTIKQQLHERALSDEVAKRTILEKANILAEQRVSYFIFHIVIDVELLIECVCIIE